MPNVHLVYPPNDALLAELRDAVGPTVEISVGRDLPQPARYHILVDGRPGEEWLTASPHLHTLVIPWAGIPAEVSERLPNHPHVAVHNLHWNAEPVAEFTVGLLLAAAKALIPADRALRQGDWRVRYAPSRTLLLRGRTALVVGYGAIGRIVARLLHGLGMTVIATRRSAAAPERDDHATVYSAAALWELLPRADVLLLTVPLTPETEGMIGSAELARLPDEAIVVNVGRGALIDEAALYEALKSDRLHAAALDVWYHYPPDKESRAATMPAETPLHELDNVVFSPHRSAALHADGGERLRLKALADLLTAAVRGEPLPNRVDLARGY